MVDNFTDPEVEVNVREENRKYFEKSEVRDFVHLPSVTHL